jgi:hypothetical protein
MQHLVVKFDVIQVNFVDDAVGGSVETGTVVARTVPGHMDVKLPSQMALESGLETPVIADVLLRPMPGTLDSSLRERDQLEVVGPADHPHINERFRVEGIQQPPMHPKNRNRFIKMRATRIRRTRNEALM